LLSGGQLTFSSVQDISFVAADAVSSKVEGGALVGDGNTNILAVEDPVVGALETNLFLPVPGGTSEVRRFLRRSQLAFSSVEEVTFIAGDTVSSGVKGLALIGDRDTHSLTVEDPVVGALKALLLTPVPKGTAEVRHFLSGSQDAFASIDDVSFVASDAISSKVESGALVGDRDADILTVEDPIVRALKADFICPIPGSASEVGVSFFGSQLAFSSI
jgi:hypothetical protein